MRRGMPPGAVELSYLEKKVLLALGKVQKASPEEIRAAGKFHELVEVMNAASWLQAKGLVTMKERVVHSYRLARPEVARRQLPERKALTAVIKAGGRIEVARVKAACKFDDAELAVALGWLRRKGWADVSKGADGSFVVVTPGGRAAAKAKGPDEILLAQIAKGELTEDSIEPHVLRDLKSRRELVKERESVRREIALTPVGQVAERRLPAVRHEGVRAPDPAWETARPWRLHRADPADLPQHGLHGNPRGLRPLRVLELRCLVPAARPSGTRPARHVLSVGARDDAPPRRRNCAPRGGGPRDRRVDREYGLAVQVGPKGGGTRSPSFSHDADHLAMARRAPGPAAEGIHHRTRLPPGCDRLHASAGIPSDRGRRDGGRREPRSIDRRDRGVLPSARLHTRQVPSRLFPVHGAEHGAGGPAARWPLDGARRQRHLPAGGDGAARPEGARARLGPRPRTTDHGGRGDLRHPSALLERPRLVARPPRRPVSTAASRMRIAWESLFAYRESAARSSHGFLRRERHQRGRTGPRTARLRCRVQTLRQGDEGRSGQRGRVLRESRGGPGGAESRAGRNSRALQESDRLGRREPAVPGRPRLILRRSRTFQRRGGTVQRRGEAGRGERAVLLVRVRYSICAEGAPRHGTVS